MPHARPQEEVLKWTVVYTYGLRQLVESAADLAEPAKALLSEAEYKAYQQHRGAAALARLRTTIVSAGMDWMQARWDSFVCRRTCRPSKSPAAMRAVHRCACCACWAHSSRRHPQCTVLPARSFTRWRTACLTCEPCARWVLMGCHQQCTWRQCRRPRHHVITKWLTGTHRAGTTRNWSQP